MIKTVLFIVYTLMIPTVPLYGVFYYRDKKDKIRETACLGLFAVQCLISLGAIVGWLGN